jgi:preprotein translocase subunit SecD
VLYFSKIRIFLVSIFTLIFIFIASSNLFKSEDSFFKKKINLGLDLHGGSYLLLEIDNKPVIEQKLQKLTSIKRNNIKDKNIKLKNLKLSNESI